MKNHLLTLLLILGAWLGGGTAQAASPGTVGAWGCCGITTVPLAAQSGVTAIAAGSFHTVALKNDGSVLAWGNASFVPTTAQSGVTAIAAGYDHTVALKSDGSVVAWGYNEHGQTTVPVAARSGVTAIAAGYNHTVALKSDGSVVAWGKVYNETNFVDATVPPGLSGVTAIAAGGGHTVALKDDGSVVAWGKIYDGTNFVDATVPKGLSGVTAIAAGSFHTVALKNDGSVLAWGNASFVPTTAQSGVTAIAAGGGHTVALKKDGSVVAWGRNDYGQSTVPVGLSGATAIAAGGAHTVVLVIPTAPTIITQPVSQAVNAGQSTSFTVTATGFPVSYQWRKDGVDLAWETSATYSLPFAWTNDAGSYTVVVSNPAGSVTSAPPAVLTVTEVPPSITTQPMSQVVNQWQSASFTVLATGYPLSYQWRKDGVDLAGATSASYSLAFAQTNQTGSSYTVVVSDFLGSVTSAPPAVLTVNPAAPGAVVAWGWWGPDSYMETDVAVAAQSGVIAIAAGAYHSVALKNDGSVLTWGGETNVPAAAQSGVKAIAAGYAHTVALKNDGSVVAWGWNGDGQTNVPVAAQSGVTAIAAGIEHTLALKNDGSVVAWGRNNYGQTMVPIAAQRGVTAIAGGYYHTVALKNDGSVIVWGAVGLEQYGLTTVPVAAQSGVTAIAAGFTHTVVLKNDGSVLAWGAYFDEAMVAQSGVTAIASGYEHIIALKNDGTVVAWGYNGYGQTTVPEGLSGVTAIAAGLSHSVVLLGAVPLLPFLDARPGGNELILSWSTNATGFTLQSTLDLTPPAPWIDVTNVPALLGAQWTVTNIFSGDTQFYRLRKP